MRGMSLAVETTVVVVIAIVVLIALMMFFGSTYSPSVDRIRLEQQKIDLCSKYITDDTVCAGAVKSEIKKDFDDMCTKLGVSTVPSVCCATYCPKPVKCTEQKMTGFKFECLLKETCLRPPAGELVAGICTESNQICCKSIA